MARKRHSLLSGVQSVVVTGLLTAIGCTGLSLWTVPSLAAESSASEILVPLSAARDDPGSLVVQAIRLCDSGQCQDAVGLLQQAVAAYRAAGDWLNLSRTLSNLSLVYQRLGNLKAAETAIDDSLAALISADDSQRQLRLRASALEVKGQLHLAMGQSQQALESWQEAETTYQSVKDGEGKIRNQLHQSSVLQEMGLYREAFKRLLPIVQMLQTQPDSPLKAVALRSLGKISRFVGTQKVLGKYLPSLFQNQENEQSDYLWQSQQLLKESRAIAQNLGLSQEEAEALLLLGNNTRSDYYRTKGIYDRAEDHDSVKEATRQAKRALGFYQEAIELAPFTALQSQVEVNQLSLLVDIKQWLQSLEKRDPILVERFSVDRNSIFSQLQAQLNQLPEIRSRIDKLPSTRETIYARLHLAQSLMKEMNSKRANGQLYSKSIDSGQFLNSTVVEELLTQALQQSQLLNDRRAYAYALGYLGMLHEKQGNLDRAQRLTEESLLILLEPLSSSEPLASPETVYQWQWQLGRILESRGEANSAIAAYDSALKTLPSLLEDLTKTNNPDLQFSFRENVEPVYRALVGLMLHSEDNSSPTLGQLRRATDLMASFHLAELENFLRCQLATQEFINIAKQEIDSTAAVIYPMILENRLAVVLKLPDSDRLHHHSIDLDRETVSEKLAALRQAVEERSLPPEGLKLSQEVYDWLIQPFETELPPDQIKTLVFVLDSSFRDIPMAALHDGQEYVVKKYAVALAPGLHLLKPQPSENAELGVLTFGLSKVRRNFPPHRNFSGLPAVEVELAKIQEQIPEQSQILLNEKFTSATLQERVSTEPFPIVHLATHGKLSADIDRTFFLAWDKRVRIYDLLNMLQSRSQTIPKVIELLVLSACETAGGDGRATLGLAGIAFRSGAHSTIASLWRVNDESTSLLMGTFYKELVENHDTITKAEALQRAQISLIDKGYDAPRFWAPYILVGNWH